VVHDHAFAFQHHTDPSIAKPTAFVRNGLHLGTYLRIVRRTVAPDSFRIDTNEPTRPALRDIMIPHRPKCSFPSFT
jgi:hypothetical protein